MLLEFVFPSALEYGDELQICGIVGQASFTMELLSDYMPVDPHRVVELPQSARYCERDPEYMLDEDDFGEVVVDDLPVVQSQPLQVTFEVAGAWDANAASPETSTSSHGSSTSRFEFLAGRPFECTLSIRSDYFFIHMNNLLVTTSEHLVPLASIHGLSIGGDALIKHIVYGTPIALKKFRATSGPKVVTENPMIVECRVSSDNTLKAINHSKVKDTIDQDEVQCKENTINPYNPQFNIGEEDVSPLSDFAEITRAPSYQLVFGLDDGIKINRIGHVESIFTADRSDDSFINKRNVSQVLLDHHEFWELDQEGQHEPLTEAKMQEASKLCRKTLQGSHSCDEISLDSCNQDNLALEKSAKLGCTTSTKINQLLPYINHRKVRSTTYPLYYVCKPISRGFSEASLLEVKYATNYCKAIYNTEDERSNKFGTTFDTTLCAQGDSGPPGTEILKPITVEASCENNCQSAGECSSSGYGSCCRVIVFEQKKAPHKLIVDESLEANSPHRCIGTMPLRPGSMDHAKLDGTSENLNTSSQQGHRTMTRGNETTYNLHTKDVKVSVATGKQNPIRESKLEQTHLYFEDVMPPPKIFENADERDNLEKQIVHVLDGHSSKDLYPTYNVTKDEQKSLKDITIPHKSEQEKRIEYAGLNDASYLPGLLPKSPSSLLPSNNPNQTPLCTQLQQQQIQILSEQLKVQPSSSQQRRPTSLENQRQFTIEERVKQSPLRVWESQTSSVQQKIKESQPNTKNGQLMPYPVDRTQNNFSLEQNVKLQRSVEQHEQGNHSENRGKLLSELHKSPKMLEQPSIRIGLTNQPKQHPPEKHPSPSSTDQSQVAKQIKHQRLNQLPTDQQQPQKTPSILGQLQKESTSKQVHTQNLTDQLKQPPQEKLQQQQRPLTPGQKEENPSDYQQKGLSQQESQQFRLSPPRQLQNQCQNKLHQRSPRLNQLQRITSSEKLTSKKQLQCTKPHSEQHEHLPDRIREKNVSSVPQQLQTEQHHREQLLDQKQFVQTQNQYGQNQESPPPGPMQQLRQSKQQQLSSEEHQQQRLSDSAGQQSEQEIQRRQKQELQQVLQRKTPPMQRREQRNPQQQQQSTQELKHWLTRPPDRPLCSTQQHNLVPQQKLAQSQQQKPLATSAQQRAVPQLQTIMTPHQQQTMDSPEQVQVLLPDQQLNLPESTE